MTCEPQSYGCTCGVSGTHTSNPGRVEEKLISGSPGGAWSIQLSVLSLRKMPRPHLALLGEATALMRSLFLS